MYKPPPAVDRQRNSSRCVVLPRCVCRLQRDALEIGPMRDAQTLDREDLESMRGQEVGSGPGPWDKAPQACFRLERLPGGIRTHWKAPPFHGARQKRTLPGKRLLLSLNNRANRHRHSTTMFHPAF
jgi:hypothetical protein